MFGLRFKCAKMVILLLFQLYFMFARSKLIITSSPTDVVSNSAPFPILAHFLCISFSAIRVGIFHKVIYMTCYQIISHLFRDVATLVCLCVSVRKWKREIYKRFQNKIKKCQLDIEKFEIQNWPMQTNFFEIMSPQKLISFL